ncbi:MAG: sulfotransferase [Rhodanobacter sp.]
MPSNKIDEIAHAITSGRGHQAEMLCRSELISQPDDENLLLLLAMSVHHQGRLHEAVAAYAKLTRLWPESSVHWNNYGIVLADAGARDEARQAYLRAIALDPGNLPTRTQLGGLLMAMHEYAEARKVLLDTLVFDPDSPLIRIPAARACALCQDINGAVALLKPWRYWTPLHDDALQLELAQVLIMRNDVPAAAEVLEELLGRNAGQPDVMLLLASVYERLNRLTDAQAMLPGISRMSAAMTDEQINEAEHLRASLAMRDLDWNMARQILERCGSQGPDDFAHHFQLGSVYDKLGMTREAMETLSVAHRLEISERRFASPQFFAAGASAMPLTAPDASAEQYSRWPKLAAPPMSDSPILIVGFPRSGTTLLEQMLDAHPGLQSMDENPFFNSLADVLVQHDPRIMDDLGVLRQFDCDELRKRYHEMVGERIRRNWDARLVDKNPLNMQWLPMIHRLFPEAKIILAVRHPCDVLLSCYMQSFRSTILVAACGSLERLARAYVQTMQCWLEQVGIFNPDVMVSRYEDLVDDFPAQSARIARFLELDDPAPLMAFDQHALKKSYIATPSYSQVIEPINRKGIARWHKYREYFEPVLPILEPMIRHWGYPMEPVV